MAKSKLVKANEKIAEKVVGGYKAIENGVVGGYKSIENGVTGGFNKMVDHFVDEFLTKEGESVEEARVRLKAEQDARMEKQKLAQPEQNGSQKCYAEENSQKAMNVAAEARRKAGLGE